MLFVIIVTILILWDPLEFDKDKKGNHRDIWGNSKKK